ncbi:hypothetical protein D0812_07845 [Vibrio owensii]|uniref:Lipoprotein n=1 Tax=Vibrio owensii TaxID=696485 RepID=A0AAP9GBF6_9VIBR|nr:hypothetical protein [Vibrio owensii]AYO14319.1 hypothetical protein D0812_07845 [Vibrio owensii]QGH46979.1 hypothetical protein APZ19_07780 [Vibrio owensii]
MSKLTRTKAIITGAGISVMLMGCSSSGHSDDAINALSIKTSADTVTEIQQAITTIQGNQVPPKIASNTFETNSHLLIVSGQLMESYNMPLNGAETELPDQYTLQLREEECGVYYEKSDKFIPLTNIQCRPNPIQD